MPAYPSLRAAGWTSAASAWSSSGAGGPAAAARPAGGVEVAVVRLVLAVSGTADERLDERGERRRAAHVGLLVGDPHLERAETRVRAHVPVVARVVRPGRQLPLLPRAEHRRRPAPRELRQAAGARRSHPGVAAVVERRVRGQRQQRREPGHDAFVGAEARLGVGHADVHVEPAHELPVDPLARLRHQVEVALLRDDRLTRPDRGRDECRRRGSSRRARPRLDATSPRNRTSSASASSASRTPAS